MKTGFFAAAALFALAAYAAALSPADLKPAMTTEEQQFYDSIKGDTDSAKNFLITRDYVRKAEAVTSGATNPALFPAKKPAGFRVAYLLPDDPTAINTALGMYLAAVEGGEANWKPHPPEAAAVLSPADLKPAMTPAEQHKYDSLKGDSAAANRFLITRDYVRKAQAVASGAMSASLFPNKKPVGFRVAYLLPGDAETINTALGLFLQADLPSR